MIDRPPALPYEAAHAEGYELEVLADIASHEYDDLEKYGQAEPSNTLSSWGRADAHPPATSVPTASFLSPATFWNPVRTVPTTMSSHQHQTTHHHTSPTQPDFSTYAQPPPPAPQPTGSQYAASVTSSGSERLTADEAELRRQRNTAASARFRAKKKRREQSLERGAGEKRERLRELEARIKELEVENGWLKDLIMETTGSKRREKGVGSDAEERSGEGEGDVLDEERKGRERKDGVGTGRD